MYISTENFEQMIKMLNKLHSDKSLKLKYELEKDTLVSSKYALVGNFVYQTNPLLTLDCDGMCGSTYDINENGDLIWNCSWLDEEMSTRDDYCYHSEPPENLGHVIAEREILEDFIEDFQDIKGFMKVDTGVYRIIRPNEEVKKIEPIKSIELW